MDRISRRLHTLCMVALSIAIPAQAQPIPWVYRLDTQPPSQVFSQGFRSEGRSGNLFNHLFLNSCYAPVLADRSIWTSFSASEQVIYAEATRTIQSGAPLANYRELPGVWLYSIRPDNSYLRVFDVLQQVIAAGDSRQMGYTSQHSEILRWLMYNNRLDESEVITQRVYPSNIYDAGFITLNHQQQITMVQESQVHNAGYRAPAVAITNQVDNLTALVPPNSIVEYRPTQNARAHSCSLECDTQRVERKRRSATEGGSYCVTPTRSQAFTAIDD